MWYVVMCVCGMFVMACLCVLYNTYCLQASLNNHFSDTPGIAETHILLFKTFFLFYIEKYAHGAINNVMSARDNTTLEQYQWRWLFEKSIFILFYKYTPSLWLLWFFYVYNIARTEQSNCHATLVEEFRT